MRHINNAVPTTASFLWIVLVLCAQQVWAGPKSAEEYIAMYQELAVEQMQKHQIPASIKLAQGILESRYGNSTLAVEANNHFGIKCHDWTGPVVYYDDDTAGECFRAYNNVVESFEDHSAFLKRSRYEALYDYKMTEYKKWAKGLAHVGYATNPRYADQLIDIIERYELHRFDTVNPADFLADSDRKNRRIKKNSTQDDWVTSHVPKKEDKRKFRGDSKKKKTKTKLASHKPQKTRGRVKKSDIFYFNRIKSVVINKEASLHQIAATYDISTSKLMKYNDLTEDAIVPANARIYLQKKRSRASYGKDVHRIEAGENMDWISQEYGVKLSCLYKKNKLSYGQEPADGELVQLRDKAIAKPQVKNANEVELMEDWTTVTRRKTGEWEMPKRNDQGNTSLVIGGEQPVDRTSSSSNKRNSSINYDVDGKVNRKVVSKKRSFDFEEKGNSSDRTYTANTRTNTNDRSQTQNRVVKEWADNGNQEVVRNHPQENRHHNTDTNYRTRTSSNSTDNSPTIFDEPIARTETRSSNNYRSSAPSTRSEKEVRYVDVSSWGDAPETSDETYRSSSNRPNSDRSTGGRVYSSASSDLSGIETGRNVYDMAQPAREGVSTGVNVYDQAQPYQEGVSTGVNVYDMASSTDAFGSNNGPTFIYRVKKGDTLYSLGKKLSVPVATIKRANNLQNNNIKVGQELVIPQ